TPFLTLRVVQSTRLQTPAHIPSNLQVGKGALPPLIFSPKETVELTHEESCSRLDLQRGLVAPKRASTTVTLSRPPAARATVIRSSQALSAVSALCSNEAIVLSSTISVSPSVQSSS